jgi:hypothetical protein
VDHLLRQPQSRGKNSSLYLKKIIPQFALIESSNSIAFPLIDRKSGSPAAILFKKFFTVLRIDIRKKQQLRKQESERKKGSIFSS